MLGLSSRAKEFKYIGVLFRSYRKTEGEIADRSFHCRVAGLSLRDSTRSSDIRREHAAGPLLLSVKRSQLRRFRYLIRRFLGRLPLELFWARPTGRRPRGRPRTRWRDYMSHLALEHPRIPQGVLEIFAGERDVWSTLLRLLSPRSDHR